MQLSISERVTGSSYINAETLSLKLKLLEAETSKCCFLNHVWFNFNIYNYFPCCNFVLDELREVEPTLKKLEYENVIYEQLLDQLKAQFDREYQKVEKDLKR